jgi:hypothetical protein
MNELPKSVLLQAYSKVPDKENNKVCIVHDVDTGTTKLRRRDNVPPEVWANMTRGMEDRIGDMFPCKRFIAHVRKVDGRTIGSANICCLCPNTGKKCGEASRKEIIAFIVGNMVSTVPEI